MTTICQVPDFFKKQERKRRSTFHRNQLRPTIIQFNLNWGWYLLSEWMTTFSYSFWIASRKVSYRSHLKNRILAQVQGGIEFQPADILKYFEELKPGSNTEIGTKELFEIVSNMFGINYNMSMVLSFSYGSVWSTWSSRPWTDRNNRRTVDHLEPDVSKHYYRTF